MPKTIRERVAELLEHECFLDPLQVKTLAENDTLFYNDLDIDSLEFVNVINKCEDEFGIRISDEDAESCATVGSLVACIERLVAAKTPTVGA